MKRRTLREWALHWSGTLLFLFWDAGKRIRGKWRRRECGELCKHLCAFAIAVLFLGFGFVIVGGALEIGFWAYAAAPKGQP